jgi:hypothetical protein
VGAGTQTGAKKLVYKFLYDRGVVELWRIEVEPEVRQWLELLPDVRYDKAERAVDMLAGQPTTLGEPYARVHSRV